MKVLQILTWFILVCVIILAAIVSTKLQDDNEGFCCFDKCRKNNDGNFDACVTKCSKECCAKVPVNKWRCMVTPDECGQCPEPN